MTTKKSGVVAALVVGVLVIGVAVVVLVDFRSPELGQALLEEVSQTTGMKWTAADFRLNLRDGLTLEKVEGKWRFPGGRIEVRVDEMIFEHQLIPLLSGKVVIERVTVKRPRLNVATRSPSPTQGTETRTRAKKRSGAPVQQPPSVSPPDRRVALEVSELRLEDGVISAFGDGEGSTSTVKGIDCVLRQLDFHSGALSPLHGLSARGKLRIKEIALGSTRVEELEGTLEAGGGRLSLDRLGFVTHGGRFSGTMTMDFNRIPFTHRISLEGGPLNVSIWIGSDDQGGLGQGFLELEAQGFGTESKNIKGSGKLTLESGTLPATPVFTLIAKAMGRNRLAGSHYQATEAVFRLEHKQLFLEPIQLNAEEAGLNLSGSLDLDGPIDLSLMVRIPREGLDISDAILDTLANEPGWVAVPFHVTGTLENPVVQRQP